MKTRIALLALSCALLLTACPGGGDGTSKPEPTPGVAFTVVDTIAGQAGVYGSVDGKGSEATFDVPLSLAATQVPGTTGDATLIYVGTSSGKIRYVQVDANGSTVKTALGTGQSGSVDGDPSTARVDSQYGFAVGYSSDASEAYAYWTETSCVVRKLTRAPGDANQRAVTVAGKANACGDADGSSANARFYSPKGIAVNPRTGEVYVGDDENSTIRRISGGTVSTLAGVAGKPGRVDGTGGAARFDSTNGLALDGAGNLYVTETYRVRKVTPSGVVTTLAGDYSGYKDGPGLEARFDGLHGIALDEYGNVYVADTGNHAIRKITPDGTVSTLVGVAGVRGDADGKLSVATFQEPYGLAYFNKRLYVSDRTSQTIRRIR